MPHPLALFSLTPLNKRAEQVVEDPCNKHLVSTLEGGASALDVGQVRPASADDATLATLGRCGDIFVEGASISKIQCSFEIDRETGIVMFYDRSHGQTSQVYGENAVQFEHGRPRKVVVQQDLNTIIGMGGVGRNLVRFQLRWHYTPDEVMAKVKERQSNSVQYNPRLARTLNEADTVAPSRMGTRIHTPGPRQPKVRWKQIGKALGAGQFGTVYKALDLDSGRIMAVKTTARPPGVNGDHLWATLKREVEILSSMSHNYIVDYIFSQGWEEGGAEIFMGLKEGTLESLVLHGCSVPAHELASTVFHHMLQALDFLSAQGIIHRDLKPENILYMSCGNGYHFQLGDFGLCNRQALAKTFAGSPLYMAPEMYYGGKQTSKADVWSLFVVTLWTLDVGGFRRLERTFSTYDHVQKTVLSLANSSALSKAREMARVDFSTRASAAQMLVRCFRGEGLTTPISQIPPIVDSVDSEDGAASPADAKSKAPAAMPDTNAAGRTPVAAKERLATAAARGRGIAKNKSRLPQRRLLQPDPVDVLIRQPGPSGVRDVPEKAPAGRRPPGSQATNVYQIPGAFPRS
ncbi:kinase-like protein [Canariomyces notabilis]|uniref:mitogen-activated protein kinase n=1 Tax=Canariomyces notabilis TaxID=2074819 RepID=A0AAN6QE59_9PEZI|nr:kinase-like protein [Canariomyces arenarius]